MYMHMHMHIHVTYNMHMQQVTVTAPLVLSTQATPLDEWRALAAAAGSQRTAAALPC